MINDNSIKQYSFKKYIKKSVDGKRSLLSFYIISSFNAASEWVNKIKGQMHANGSIFNNSWAAWKIKSEKNICFIVPNANSTLKIWIILTEPNQIGLTKYNYVESTWLALSVVFFFVRNLFVFIWYNTNIYSRIIIQMWCTNNKKSYFYEKWNKNFFHFFFLFVFLSLVRNGCAWKCCEFESHIHTIRHPLNAASNTTKVVRLFIQNKTHNG